MESIRALALAVFSMLFLAFPIANSNGKRQIETLSHLYKQKSKTTHIDTRPFRTNAHLGDAQILSQEGDSKKDRITYLPGLHQNVSFQQYSGYVTLDKKGDRALFYYFAEADQEIARKLPLVLWLNGGPGCSSLGYGAMEELGPFRVGSDGRTLYLNNYSWNQAANILFLETPVGVGFSYSKIKQDIEISGDNKTAQDNFSFLVNWLERFPEYKDRKFYIAGESYAGHYVPQLAQTILDHNLKAKRTIVNLKGIIIGNAVINEETDNTGEVEYLGTHGLLSNETMTQILKYCDYSLSANENSPKCYKAVDQGTDEIGHIDFYNIYAPLCHSNLTTTPKDASVLNFDPCSDNYVNAYLNRPEVQKALHANGTYMIPYEWSACSSSLLQNWTDSPTSMLPVLHNLLKNHMRVWIYSGDIDAVVPVTSTQLSINKMNLQITSPWKPWYLSQEVAGYITVYDGGLTFSTIRGAGHAVPSYQPARALALFKKFLRGK